MIHIEQFTFNAFQTRCCIVWNDEKFCAFVDPGCASTEELSRLTDFISRNELKPVCIMLTHAHFDHIYGVSGISKYYGNLPVYMDMEEMYTIENTNPYVCKAYGLPLPDTSFTQESDEDGILKAAKDGEVIEVGNLKFRILGTPGHSRGGLCFYEAAEKVLFSGDTLFAGSIGRTDHPGGDYDQLMKSIFEKLMDLDGPVKVIPGHGPCSDIATERTTNPFLQPFNEPFEE